MASEARETTIAESRQVRVILLQVGGKDSIPGDGRNTVGLEREGDDEQSSARYHPGESKETNLPYPSVKKMVTVISRTTRWNSAGTRAV